MRETERIEVVNDHPHTMVTICNDESVYTITGSPFFCCGTVHSWESTMFSKNITCIACGHEGSTEIGDTTAHPPSEIFSYLGHNNRSNHLYVRCPCCGASLAVDPLETMNSKTLRGSPSPVDPTDFNLPRKRSPRFWLSLSIALLLYVIVLMIITFILTKM